LPGFGRSAAAAPRRALAPVLNSARRARGAADEAFALLSLPDDLSCACSRALVWWRIGCSIGLNPRPTATLASDYSAWASEFALQQRWKWVGGVSISW